MGRNTNKPMSQNFTVSGSLIIEKSDSTEESDGTLTCESLSCIDMRCYGGLYAKSLSVPVYSGKLQKIACTPFGMITAMYGTTAPMEWKSADPALNGALCSFQTPVNVVGWYCCDGSPIPSCEATTQYWVNDVNNVYFLPDYRDRVLWSIHYLETDWAAGQINQGEASFSSSIVSTTGATVGGYPFDTVDGNDGGGFIVSGSDHTHSLTIPPFKSAAVNYFIYLGPLK